MADETPLETTVQEKAKKMFSALSDRWNALSKSESHREILKTLMDALTRVLDPSWKGSDKDVTGFVSSTEVWARKFLEKSTSEQPLGSGSRDPGQIIQELNDERTKLLADLELAQQDTKTLKEEKKDLESRVEQLEKEEKEAIQRLDEYSKKISGPSEEVDALQTKIDSAPKPSEEAPAPDPELQKKLEQAEQERDALKAKAATYETTISEVTAERERFKQNLGEVSRELEKFVKVSESPPDHRACDARIAGLAEMLALVAKGKEENTASLAQILAEYAKNASQ